ncbi:MAG: SspB family protein [Paracoccaceae bacterium]
MSHSIDYGTLMHRAMRGLIQNVLHDVQANGLPGEHHFFITFDTRHPDVQIADWLSDRYPGDMTVVMQHWFDDLSVTDDGFAVTLNFGEAPERLFVPYDAIKTFVDPSVEFGLRFETQDDEGDEEDGDLGAASDMPTPLPAATKSSEEGDTDADAPAQDAEVVSLDSFRK